MGFGGVPLGFDDRCGYVVATEPEGERAEPFYGLELLVSKQLTAARAFQRDLVVAKMGFRAANGHYAAEAERLLVYAGLAVPNGLGMEVATVGTPGSAISMTGV